MSIRQPWAWLIVHGPKRFENRGWQERNPSLAYMNKGMRFLIHAAKGMTHAEYDEAHAMAEERGVVLPPLHDLARGGIVGVAEVVQWHWTRPKGMDWAFGSGIELTNVQPVTFAPCVGALGFFRPQFDVETVVRLVKELVGLGLV